MQKTNDLSLFASDRVPSTTSGVSIRPLQELRVSSVQGLQDHERLALTDSQLLRATWNINPSVRPMRLGVATVH